MTTELTIRTTRVNETDGFLFADWREPIAKTIFADTEPAELRGELYRACVREYGRCTGKVYVDSKSRGTIQVGWCFVKHERYDDCNETFRAETWVTLERETEPARPAIVEAVDLARLA